MFDRSEYTIDVGDRRLALTMSFGPDVIAGFCASSQGEDFESYSMYDAAYLVVAQHSPGARIPAGEQLYELLLGR